MHTTIQITKTGRTLTLRPTYTVDIIREDGPTTTLTDLTAVQAEIASLKAQGEAAHRGDTVTVHHC